MRMMRRMRRMRTRMMMRRRSRLIGGGMSMGMTRLERISK
jgi:hypothetical protein